MPVNKVSRSPVSVITQQELSRLMKVADLASADKSALREFSETFTPAVVSRLLSTASELMVLRLLPDADLITFPDEKVKPLTMAQVYVLRRMNSGTAYQIKGDGNRGRELRTSGYGGSSDVASPSIPALYKRGLIELEPIHRHITPGLFYSVRLTPEGHQDIKVNAYR